ADERIRAADALERPALCGDRRGGSRRWRGRPLAAATVVEAVRQLDLVRRSADRAGRPAGADRPRRERPQAPFGALARDRAARGGGGVNGMRLFLWGLVAVAAAVFGLFAYQLTQPKDEFVASAMIGEPIPPFALPPIVSDRPGLASADLADGQAK